MSHELRLIRGLTKRAVEVLLSHPPVQEPGCRLQLIDPPRKKSGRNARPLESVRRQFLTNSLRWLFTGQEGSEIVAVLSYATSSLIVARVADKGGRRIRYGMDAGGPFRRVAYRRTGPFQRKASERRISFEELLSHARDPEETYRSICALIVEGAMTILGIDEVRSIIESEQRPEGVSRFR